MAINPVYLLYFLETSVRGPQVGAGGDLLSVLLNKGNKLREEMIISALDSKAKAQQEVKVDNVDNTEPKQIHEPIQIDEPNISVRCVIAFFNKKTF